MAARGPDLSVAIPAPPLAFRGEGRLTITSELAAADDLQMEVGGVPAQGGTSVIVPLFDPAGVMAAIEAEHVTMTVMVPTMIGMLLNHETFAPERLASLRALTYGASPMPAALLDKLLGAFPALDIYQGYGMTGLVKSVAQGWGWLSSLYRGPIEKLAEVPRRKWEMIPPPSALMGLVAPALQLSAT